MLVLFEKLKKICVDDELMIDFLDCLCRDNEICCENDIDLFASGFYRGQCSESCSVMHFLGSIFHKIKEKDKFYEQKKRFFVNHCIENTDIFGKLIF